MDCISTRIPYRQTRAFSDIVLNYLDLTDDLEPFYNHPPTLQGIQKAIEERNRFATGRDLLVRELQRQYHDVAVNDRVKRNIEILAEPKTFTVTTAHQPNIFTGPLYFIYKILHAIQLAAHLETSLPGYRFVPVYYMGSEDADLDELGNFYINGEKLTWNTRQTGAVGRMKVDKELLKLIGLAEGQLAVLPYGKEIIKLVNECYHDGETVQQATFRFLHALFGKYGLVILIPDSPALKQQMIPVFEDDLLNQSASEIVGRTAASLQAAGYKIQANPREINLFYLQDGVRERIETRESKFIVKNTKISFSKEALLAELKDHPERFSPNVILRGLYQETILPNIAFIGGGGELAYWLQYKALFTRYQIPFPVLVLRNSFLVTEKKWFEKIARLGFAVEDFFLPEQELVNRMVIRDSDLSIKLNGSLQQVEHLYESFRNQAAAVDTTLAQHVDALKTQTLHRLQELEKKMLRAEKRKFTDQQRQVRTIREKLFPGNGLQERIDNFMPYYALWGPEFLDVLLRHSLTLEQEFVILCEK